jgi:hypothetical protein
MRAYVKNWFNSFDRILGVHAVIKNDCDDLILSCCLLEKRKGKIELISKMEACSIQDIIDFDVPISLSISGDGILFKVFQSTPDVDYSLSEIMPDINLESVYVSQLNLKGSVYFAIARKGGIKNVLNLLKNAQIIQLEIGPIVVLRSFDALFGEMRDLVTSEYVIQKRLDQFEVIRNENNTITSTYELSDTLLDGKTLIAFCSAFDPFLNYNNSVGVDTEEIKSNRAEYQQKVIFNNGVKLGLGLFFVLLLGNFLAFSLLSSQNEKLTEKIISSGSGYQKQDSLIKELDDKRRFLKDAGWLDNSTISFYADQLAESRPLEVIWTELVIFPKIKKENEAYDFLTKNIRVIGEAKSAYELNKWQKDLSKIKWIKGVELEYLKKNEEKQLSNFSIMLEVK